MDRVEVVVGALLLLGLAVNAGLLLLAISKLRWVHKAVHKGASRLQWELREESFTLFQQIQHLERLRVLLQTDRPLPIMRGWSASPDILCVLAQHVLAAKPRLVVECGSGSSTVVIARCLELNGGGHMVSLDADAEFAGRTRAMLEQAGLDRFVTVRHAPLRPVSVGGGTQPWYATDQLPDEPIDMLVVDGPPIDTAPLARYPAGSFLVSRVRKGGVVFLDDADRPDERTIVTRWLGELPQLERGPRHYCEKGCLELRVK